MLVKLTVTNLLVNLPLEDCDIFFLLNDKNRENSLPDQLNYELTDEYVLTTDTTDANILESQFVLQVQNPQESKYIDLNVFAISNSDLKVILLGSSEVNVKNLINRNSEDLSQQNHTVCLKGVEHQKGNITFKFEIVQPDCDVSMDDGKFSDSFQKEETSSSDSYEANLKEWGHIHQEQTQKQISQSLEQPLGKGVHAISSQSIIFEDIELEDFEDMFGSDSECEMNLQSKKTTFQIQQIKDDSPKIKLEQKKIKLSGDYLLQERIKIMSYLHRLQESDFLMMSIEQRMIDFLQ